MILVSLWVRQWTVVISENILGRYWAAKFHGETITLGAVIVSFH